MTAPEHCFTNAWLPGFYQKPYGICWEARLTGLIAGPATSLPLPRLRPNLSASYPPTLWPQRRVAAWSLDYGGLKGRFLKDLHPLLAALFIVRV
ncbi:MAG: hypothetical protein LQ341_000164 [Variospora aurantia]|nr:MAG: hypothetical protein LQ341_000164 [Variospora aurantia]